MKWAGICVAMMGLLGIIIGWRMDTSVPLSLDQQLGTSASTDRQIHVSNLYLMQRQQNAIIIGCAALLSGVLVFGFGLMADRRKPNDENAEEGERIWHLDLNKQRSYVAANSISPSPNLHGERIDWDGVRLVEKRWLGIYYYVRDQSSDENSKPGER